MRIELKKFGVTLISRQAGSEAWKAFQPQLRTAAPNEPMEVDFAGVFTLSPSWADEFVSSLMEERRGAVTFLPSENLSVQATLRLLREIHKGWLRPMAVFRTPPDVRPSQGGEPTDVVS